MPRTWDRSRFAPWLLRELVQVNEKHESLLPPNENERPPPRASVANIENSLIKSNGDFKAACSRMLSEFAPSLVRWRRSVARHDLLAPRNKAPPCRSYRL